MAKQRVRALDERYLKEGLGSVSCKKDSHLYYKTVCFSVYDITVRNNWRYVYNV
jgi:hypothetical protein